MTKSKSNAARNTRLSIVGIILSSSIACATQAQANSIRVDNVQQMMSQLTKMETNNRGSSVRNNPFSRLQERKKDEGKQFLNDFEITSFRNRDGNIEIRGHQRDNPRAFLRLNGTQNRLQGRLSDIDARRVYEFETSTNGDLIKKEVPIEKYYPDLSDQWIAAINEAKQTVKNKQRESSHPRLQQRFVNGQPVFSTLAQSQAPHINSFSNEDLRKLQSRPGSQYVIFLNQASILDANGAPLPINVSYRRKPSYVNVTKADVYRVWQVVASQYSMLDLNITTDKAIFDAAEASKKLEMRYQNKGCVSWQSYDSFGKPWTADLGETCMDSENSHWALGVGITIAHEIGHALSLGHDGSTIESDAYFNGLPAVAWVPLMGNFWYAFGWTDPLIQLSKSEYTNAVNEVYPRYQTTLDDLQMIQKYVPRLSIPANNEKPLQINAGKIEPASNFGQIVSATDTAKFNFTLSSNSTLELIIEPIEVMGALDVKASIVDANNVVVATFNPQADRTVKVVNQNLPAGTYKIQVSGGAELTPQTGFSNYASLGYFAMSGTIGATALKN